MPANVNCPQCNGHLEAAATPEEYECESCGRRLRQVVVDNLDSFQRVAESDGPAAEIAKVALEGVEGQ
ncbi:hypothetical protein ACKVMT_06175 [Halobacteriales archaeon Cl-PHB]